MFKCVPAIDVQLFSLKTSISNAFLRYLSATFGFLVLWIKHYVLFVVTCKVVVSDTWKLN